MEKKELKEKLIKTAKARGFVCEASSGKVKVKDLQLTFNQKELLKLISEELDKARREYFSMGMEYFSLIDDSNIYQKKGWKLPEEKAERLQILDKMFNLLKDNK